MNLPNIYICVCVFENVKKIKIFVVVFFFFLLSNEQKKKKKENRKEKAHINQNILSCILLISNS